MAESRQQFIGRNRAPRIHITYARVEGEPEVEIPFVMGVMADLSGKPEEELPPLDDRDFKDLDAEIFDKFLKRQKPRVAFSVPNVLTDEGGNLGVELTFECMDDFLPDEVAKRVEPLRKLFEARTRIDNLLTWIDGKGKAENLFGQLFARNDDGSLVNKNLLESLASHAASGDDTQAAGDDSSASAAGDS